MSQAQLAVPNSLQNKSDAPYLNSLGALITGAVTQRFGYAPGLGVDPPGTQKNSATN
jgi:hypothetical protein